MPRGERVATDRKPGIQAGDTSPAASDFDATWETRAKVAFKVHLPKETLDLLRDLSLARAISDLAASVKVDKKGSHYRQPSISRVIAEIVEERRTALEHEVEIVRGITRERKAKAQQAKDSQEAGKTAPSPDPE